MLKTYKSEKIEFYLVRGLYSFCGLTCGEVKIDESGSKSDDLNSWTFCAEPRSLGVAIGDRLLMKSKTGESCKWKT